MRQQTPRFKRSVGGLIGDVELSTGARKSSLYRAGFACPPRVTRGTPVTEILRSHFLFRQQAPIRCIRGLMALKARVPAPGVVPVDVLGRELKGQRSNFVRPLQDRNRAGCVRQATRHRRGTRGLSFVAGFVTQETPSHHSRAHSSRLAASG